MYQQFIRIDDNCSLIPGIKDVDTMRRELLIHKRRELSDYNPNILCLVPNHPIVQEIT